MEQETFLESFVAKLKKVRTHRKSFTGGKKRVWRVTEVNKFDATF